MGASVDLEWSALDADLTRSVAAALSEAFSQAARPSFVGEIDVTSFSFGDVVPEIELVDVCDIYKEFFEVPDDDIATDEAPEARSTTPIHHDSMTGEPFNQSMADEPAKGGADHAPAVQLHVRVAYEGNMSIGLSTSLLINYPTPRFMSLPLKLTVVSMAFRGTFIVAYEGPKRRVHLSILDPKQEMLNGTMSYFPPPYAQRGRAVSTTSTAATSPAVSPSNVDDESPPANSSMILPPTAGARLLQDAIVETEVGQADRHVLRNVGKVEKFVVDLVRSTLQSELVFPFFFSHVPPFALEG